MRKSIIGKCTSRHLFPYGGLCESSVSYVTPGLPCSLEHNLTGMF